MNNIMRYGYFLLPYLLSTVALQGCELLSVADPLVEPYFEEKLEKEAKERVEYGVERSGRMAACSPDLTGILCIESINDTKISKTKPLCVAVNAHGPPTYSIGGGIQQETFLVVLTNITLIKIIRQMVRLAKP